MFEMISISRSTLWVLLSICALSRCDIRVPVILILGERTDLEIDPYPLIRTIGLVPTFEKPQVIWNPSDQDILNLQLDAPIFIITHTTKSDYMVKASHSYDPTDNIDYYPTWPLVGFTPGDIFMWGFPEPFAWYNVTDRWHHAKTRTQTIYPYRNFDTVILCSCFGKFMEDPAFPNMRGLFDYEAWIPDDADGKPAPVGRVLATAQWYSEARHVNNGTAADFFRIFDERKHILITLDAKGPDFSQLDEEKIEAPEEEEEEEGEGEGEEVDESQLGPYYRMLLRRQRVIERRERHQRQRRRKK